MRICGVFFFVNVFFLAVAASGRVILTGKNITSSFGDVEANIGSCVRESGISGTLYLAEPLDACSSLASNIDMGRNGSSSPFALIIRGGCSFEDKVRRAQIAGYKAAIVYDNVYGDLVAMAGISGGIDIAAVFVSKASGETIGQYAGIPGIVVYILPSFENTASAIMAISFISLLAMSAMLATCFFVRRQHIRRSQVRESHGMSNREVKAMPSLTFTSVAEDNSTSRTCAICLEDYNVGEKLRILPCRHKFHAVCVDGWLTSWRTFCPVCKGDARSGTRDPITPPPSESTPLLPLSISFRSSSSATSFQLPY